MTVPAANYDWQGTSRLLLLPHALWNITNSLAVMLEFSELLSMVAESKTINATTLGSFDILIPLPLLPVYGGHTVVDTTPFNAVHSNDDWKWLYMIINSTPLLKERQFNTINMQIYHNF
jgi:hypothetical protein